MCGGFVRYMAIDIGREAPLLSTPYLLFHKENVSGELVVERPGLGLSITHINMPARGRRLRRRRKERKEKERKVGKVAKLPDKLHIIISCYTAPATSSTSRHLHKKEEQESCQA